MAKEIPPSNPTHSLSHESIARRAYEIWESEGCPQGRDMEHWLRALSDLKRQSSRAESRVVSQPRADENTPETSKPRIPRRPAPRMPEKRFQTAGR